MMMQNDIVPGILELILPSKLRVKFTMFLSVTRMEIFIGLSVMD